MTPYRVFTWVVLCLIVLSDVMANRYLSARLSNAVGVTTLGLWILTLVGAPGSIDLRPRLDAIARAGRYRLERLRRRPK